MKSRHTTFLAFLVLLIVGALPLTAAQIVCAPNAAPAEVTAAQELSKYLGLISGKPAFPVVTVVDETLGKPVFHVGQTADALVALGVESWENLKLDEVLYRVKDGEVWLAGAAPRGTLYAVYEFLEREYGVRFFTADDELVPGMTPLHLPPDGTFHRYAPAFFQRSAAYSSINNNNPAFAAKLRNNYFFVPSAPEWGGYDGLIGWCHTLNQFLPSTKYFEAHPEWYAMRNGVRQGGPGNQMCLTNHEMRQELIKVVREKLKANPQSHFISVSQNDNKRPCECDDCKAFVQANGNETDLLLDCVNEVAEMVAKEFPNVFVETLAYNYTRQPPKTIRPLDNVAIRYCTIEAAGLAPMESPLNATLAEELKAWQPIAKHTMIWNYVTDFAKYYLPHPNWTFLDKDLRFFRDNNAISIFEQGSHDHCGHASDLTDLRAYLISRLLWNPDLDGQELIHEFVDHHYGPAAKYVYAYLDGVTAAVARHPDCIDTCYVQNTHKWLNDSELAQLWSEVYEGVVKFGNDPIYGPRMGIAALPLTMTLLDNSILLETPPEERLAPLRDVDPVTLIDFCEKHLALAKADHLCEGFTRPTKIWIAQRRALFTSEYRVTKKGEGDRPEGLPEGDKWWGWNAETLGSLLNDLNNPFTIALKDDPNATGGKAVWMPNTHTEWYLQMNDLPAGKYDLYLTLRCDLKPGKPAEGEAMSCGSYPAGPYPVHVKASEIAGSEYKLVHLGVSNLSRTQYIYCAPIINPNVECIWIDRLFVVKPADSKDIQVIEEF